jgi:thioredoxin-related protein
MENQQARMYGYCIPNKAYDPLGRFILIILLLTTIQEFSFSQEQAAATPAPYERFKNLPPFELKGLDGKAIKRDNLLKNRGTILMFFSPDCNHCLQQMDWMKQVKEELKAYNFVLATYQPLEELKGFYQSFKLNEWKNIYIGRDEKYFLPPYFRIRNLPFIALYDKKGQLISVFEGNTKTDLILASFK